MSAVEPPDPDDLFNQIVKGVNVSEPSGANFSLLDTESLFNRYHEVRSQLKAIKYANTEEGRGLESELSSIVFVLKKRGVL